MPKHPKPGSPSSKKKKQSGCLTAFVPPGILKTPSFGAQSVASDTKSQKSVRWEGISTSTLSLEDHITEWDDLKFNVPRVRNLQKQQQIYEELDRRLAKAHRKKSKKSGKRHKRHNYRKRGELRARGNPPTKMRAQPHKASYVIYTIFLLCLATCVSLLYWAEWLRVNAFLEYLPLHDFEPVSCEPNMSNNGKVVHIDCPITKLYKFYPAKEFSWNMDSTYSLFLETKVEMYQYVVSPAKFGVSMAGKWSENREKSLLYSIRNYTNPHFWPTVPGQGRQFPPRLFAGSFELNPEVLTTFKKLKQIPLRDDGYYQPSVTQPPPVITYYNSMAYNDYLYTGNPESPTIGDMRISFYVSDATHLSTIGRQLCDSYSCRIVPVSRNVETKIESEEPNTSSPQDFFKQYFGYGYLDDKFVDAVMAVREDDFSGDELLSESIADKSLSTRKVVVLRFITMCFSLIVGIWSIGLIHPNKWFMWTNGRTGNIIGLLLSGLGVSMFVVFGLVSGPIWLLASVIYGGILVAFGIIGLISTIILTCTMSSIQLYRQGNGYTELKHVPEEFDRDPPHVEMDAPLVPNSNKTESSFYQAI